MNTIAKTAESTEWDCFSFSMFVLIDTVDGSRLSAWQIFLFGLQYWTFLVYSIAVLSYGFTRLEIPCLF